MLYALLEKLGIKSLADLKPAERATYINWAQVLEKGDVSNRLRRRAFVKAYNYAPRRPG